jgi:hypothetical protein
MTRFLGNLLAEILCSLSHAVGFIGTGCLITYVLLKVAA